MPLTTRYMAALHLARNAGTLLHEFFAHRQFMFGGHANREDFTARSAGTLQTLIRTKLGAAFPGDAIVDEHFAGSGLASLARAWIVGPVSGRKNFVRGIPFYAVSLAYVEDDRCELAVIYDPEHDELFHARRGDGAFCEHAGTDTRLEAARCDALEGSLLCIGDDDGQPDPGYLIVRHELMDVGATVRAMGSAALELAHVAAGRSDGFVGLHTNAQLVRAGLLLVEESGGYTLQPALAEGTQAGAPILGCAAGISAALTAAATPWSTRRALERSGPSAVH
jgi:myo-inositol-1(or 4)-monophosphatase